MKKSIKIWFVVIFITFIANKADPQLLGNYEFNTGADCFSTDPDPLDKNATVTAIKSDAVFSSIKVSSNNPCLANPAEYRSITWTNSPTPDTLNFFYSFSVSTCGSCELNLTEIDVDLYRPASPYNKGPDSGAVYTSIDGGTYKQSGDVFVITETKTTFIDTMSVVSAAGGNVAFKIIAWHGQNSGTNSQLLLDNVKIYGTTNTPLPINLLSFNAEVTENEVLFQWTTASEINNDYFTIERSNDTFSFREITTVKGAGNSTNENHYTASDKTPLTGEQYYRLKQTDYDGKYKYSDILHINFSLSNIFNVFPNPCDGNNLYLNLPFSKDKEVLIVLYDVYGTEIYSKVIIKCEGTTIKLIDSEKRLSPGVYLVTASSDKKMYKQRIVIS